MPLDPLEPLPDVESVPDDYFSGNRRIVTGELSALLNRAADINATRLIHAPTLTPGSGSSAPGQGPTPIVLGGSVLGLNYATVTDASYRVFKINPAYVGDASFHIHWTKSANPSEAGRVVRWRIRYTVFDGSSEDVGAVAAQELLFDDTYEDASTDATRIVHRTANVSAAGFMAGYYVGIRIDYVAANTTLLSSPVLVSADLLATELINR